MVPTRALQSRFIVAEAIAGRAKFNVDRVPPELRLGPLREDDEGEYWCRVDYREHRTQHYLIHLNVTVPPSELIITDANGKRVNGVIGPYNEGDNLAFTCTAKGGTL